MKTQYLKKLAVLSLVVLNLTAVAPAGSEEKIDPGKPPVSLQELDDVTMDLMSTYNIPGVAIVAVKGNSIVYMKGFGTSDGENRFGPDTHFYIASNTKSFTGLAMATLIEQGRVGLDDPVTRYIPSHFFPGDVDADAVTIRDLLAHTTGLADDPLISRTAYSGQTPGDLRTLLRFSQYRNDDHGKSFKYSNLGYVIAGMIIEQVTGQDWRHYETQALLEPAGMVQTSTSVPAGGSNAALPFETGSARPLKPLAFRKTDATMHAAGGLYSTLPDMGRWLTLFTDPAQTRIPETTIARASTSLVDGLSEGMGPFRLQGYGYGWIHGTVWSTPLRFHFGSFPGYESMVSYMPGESGPDDTVADGRLGIFVYVNERIGGLRVAATLSSLYYDLMRGDPALDEHMGNLGKMLASTYAPDDAPVHAFLPRSKLSGLCGTYANDAYGTLVISAADDGYLVSLGDLHSHAYMGEDDKKFGVSWIPGKTEAFEVGYDGNRTSLQYEDYGVFNKKTGTENAACRTTTGTQDDVPGRQ